LSGVLLWGSALSREVAHTTTVEADVARGGSSGQWKRQALRMRCWW
jgi:hypothetical protein